MVLLVISHLLHTFSSSDGRWVGALEYWSLVSEVSFMNGHFIMRLFVFATIFCVVNSTLTHVMMHVHPYGWLSVLN